MAIRYKLDGTNFPVDPTSKRWRRQEVQRGGTGETIYSAFWSVELDLPILDIDADSQFFFNAWQTGGLHTATLAHPKTGIMTGFTGVNIASYEFEFMDVESDNWVEGGRLVLDHISLSATGTP